MVLLASVLAAIASQAGLGTAPSVRVPDYELVTPLELPLILVFGACCGLVSASCTYSNKVSCSLCCGLLLSSLGLCQLRRSNAGDSGACIMLTARRTYSQEGDVTLASGDCHEQPILCQLRSPSQLLRLLLVLQTCCGSLQRLVCCS